MKDDDRPYPNDENGQALQQMAERGVDLSRPRVIDFEHVFPTAEAAHAFAEAVRGLAMRVVEYGPEPNPVDPSMPWEVRCRQRMKPTHANITDFEKAMSERAAEFGGRADGWGCLSNPDGSPVDSS